MSTKKIVMESEQANTRLDVFLRTQEKEFSRTALQSWIAQGHVQVNGRPVKAHYILRVGDEVCWRGLLPVVSTVTAEKMDLDILHEDEAVLVVNKPSGLVVHPGAGNREHTLVNALLAHSPVLSSVSPERPGIVHRLDKETSGVMVVAKTNASHLSLARQFKDHTIERRYIALVSGRVEFDEGLIDVPIKRHVVDRRKMSVSFTEEAKKAQTRYHVLRREKEWTALELFPQTGRTHQLRVHLSYLGHPILGDATYGRKETFSRLALHAMDLGFSHPMTEKWMRFQAPLPGPMREKVGDCRI